MKQTDSQCTTIANYLLKGRSITWIEALELAGTNCLPRRILDLKERGLDIDIKEVKLKNGKRIGQYFIPKDKLTKQREKWIRLQKKS
jgi:hypothetical protein